MIKQLLFILITLLPMISNADVVKIDGIYFNLAENEAEVKSSRYYYSGVVVIPSTVIYNNKIYSVTRIGDSAFTGCNGLISITIPNSVTSIGEYTFSDCIGLTSITIPNSVTSIGRCAFQNCSGLTSITIPNSVTSIGDYAFSGNSLTSIQVESGNKVFDSRGNCNAIIETATNTLIQGCQNSIIPNSVTGIGDSAFSDCNGLTSITIPDGVTSIGDRAFSRCGTLTSIIIPNGLAVIGYEVFYKCSGLTSITIPESMTSIGDRAFSRCVSLTSIIIPNGLTSIGKEAFYGCSGLASITIPSSVINIGHEAFGETPWLTNQPDGLVYAGKVAYKYKGSIPNGTHITLEEGTLGIASSAFSYCSGLTSVTIPKSVTSIGDGAFSGFSGLTSITIPNSVTSIGDYAFSGCSGLTSITIPNSVISIGSNAFFICRGLTSVTIPNSVSCIGVGAFEYCSALTSITIPNSVTRIGDYAFRECSGLTSITIPNSVTSIGSGAFYGTPWLNNQPDGLVYAGKVAYVYKGTMPSETHITLEEGTLGIAASAFSGCSGLTSVTIPNSVKSIGSGAFYGTPWLNNQPDGLVYVGKIAYKYKGTMPVGTHITIEEGTLEIADAAFSGCHGLISITIPNGVTSIGASAFDCCSALPSIIIPNSVTSIGSGAFYGCNGLASVTIPNSVTSIGSGAFYGCNGLTNVTISDRIVCIGKAAFMGCNKAKIYAKRGTDGLIAVWNYGLEAYEAGTTNIIPRPLISMKSNTQTSITYQIRNVYPELNYEYGYNGEYLGDNEYIITGLRPEYTQVIGLIVRSENNVYSTSSSLTTLSLNPEITCEDQTCSSLTVKGRYTMGDAKVISHSIAIDGVEYEGENGTKIGLDPNKSYNCKYNIVVEYGNGDKYTYYYSQDFSTAPLNLVTQQPKVISSGNAIVSAESNLNGQESKIGFEWRRIEWTDDFASNTIDAWLYDGRLEGYIRNLNTEKLWKYRPYYESNTGNRYYGQWVGIDPTNTNYYEPTVYTNSSIKVAGNTVELKGYAMRGTDNVTKQGFMYWKNSSGPSIGGNTGIPFIAKTIEASGNVMTANINNLEYDTEYCFVAFVKTASNETFYGEQQTFRTEMSQDVIDGIEVNEELRVKNAELSTAVYDLNGRKLSAPQKGINIIRMSDGTTRMVMIK